MLKMIEDITNLVFPKICPGCNRPLLKEEESICLHCLSNLPERLTLNNEELRQRFYGRLNLEEAYAFLLFKRKGLTQNLLHSLKYSGNQSLGLVLGQLFGNKCKSLSFFSTIDVVVPIPLHQSKLRFRGFNQSELIADGLASSLSIKLDSKSVIRSIKTSTQTKKTRMERWKNVDQTFKTINSNLDGKHVLLVDDVITTGATIESCGQTILAAGAAKVSIACLALA
jgi:ComF family protein